METVQNPLIKQGWLRALIYFVGVSVIVYFFASFSSYLMDNLEAGTEKGDESIIQFGLMYSLMGVLIFIFTWVSRKFIDKRSFESLGFTWKGFSNEAWTGFFAAIAILGVGTVILVAAGHLSFIGASLDVAPLLLEIVIMIIVAFVEELLFRGYLLNNLMQSVNKWGALSITAALFSLFHGSNPDISLFAVINIFLAGILLGINYIFTKNIWFSIFFHFAWNYFQGPVLGYDVSGLKLTSLLHQSMSGPEAWTGGPFGFEGSVLCAILIIVTALVFSYVCIKRYGTT